VTGLSKLAGYSNPTLGTQISTIGGAVIQAGTAVGQFSSLFGAAGSALGAASLIGAVTPVGAIIGAGFAIFSALSSSGSASANAAVLQAIQQLSTQIARLQQDVDVQFAQVDSTLSTILNTLNQDFALVNFQLGAISGDINAIQAGLLDVESSLNQLAVLSLAFFQTAEYESMVQNMNACLQYRSVHNGADITQQGFNACENAFYTAATSQALDQIWAWLQNPNYADATLYNIFADANVTGVCSGCASPFNTLINFLAGYPAANLNLPALSSTRLANPDIWSLMARSYHDLLTQWPGYAATINTSRLNDVIQQGLNIQQTSRAGNSNTSGGSVTPYPAIFNALITKYKSAVSGVQTAAQADLNSYIANPANGITNTSNGITLSLFAGGSNQHTSWRPSIAMIKNCDGSGTALQAPANLLSKVPDLFAFSQGYLGSGQITSCLDNLSWTNQQTTYVPAGAHTCDAIKVVAKGYNYFTCPPGCYPNGAADVLAVTACLFKSVVTTAHVSAVAEVEFTGSIIVSATGVTDSALTMSSDTAVCSEMEAHNCVAYKYAHSDTALSDALSANWSTGQNLLSKFTSNPQVVPPTSQQLLQQTQLLSGITAQIDALARKHQQNIYKNIAADFGVASAVQSAGQFLTATKLLLQAFASVSLPSALETYDAFRAALYGAQAIEDAPTVQVDLSAFAASSIPDTTDNKLTDEVSLLNSRASSLSSALTAVFNGIQQNQTPDSLQQIDTTLQDLQSLHTLKSASALAPCNYQLSTPVVLANPAGATTSLGIQVEPGCAWRTASSSASWVSVSSGQGSGNGAASLSFAPNTTGTARAAVIVAGEQILRVLQGAAAPGSVPPAAPSLTSPSDGTTGVSLAPTLSWSTSSFASSYSVYLGTSSSPALFATVNNTSYTLPALSPGTVYYWKVAANDTAGSASSAVASFTTQVVPPQAPALVSPISGATGVGLTPMLAWNASTGATSYIVYLGTSSSPPQVANVTGNSVAVPSLTAGTTYYWRVAASNSAGSTTSPTFTFTTQPAAPAAPVLSSPANSATGFQRIRFSRGIRSPALLATTSLSAPRPTRRPQHQLRQQNTRRLRSPLERHITGTSQRPLRPGQPLLRPGRLLPSVPALPPRCSAHLRIRRWRLR
jgi:hypothetical protein